MKKLLIITFICILFFTTSYFCKGEKNPISSNETKLEIVPLKLNNQWYLQITSFDSLGIPINSNVDTVTVCCDTVYSGTTYYRYSLLMKTWFYNDDEGLWSVRYNPGSGFGQPMLEYKYPCNKGDQFNDVFVVSTDTLINVRFGEVTCIMYRSLNHTQGIVETYMKPGIGVIKSAIYLLNSSNEFIKFSEAELIGYQF